MHSETIKPPISIIVPIYNAEKNLRRCIDSILIQTYSNYELILINDGSTDDSGLICDEYAAADSRVRVFHKPNGGVSSARNLGLEKAKGDWITFCDADDYTYPEWLENYDIGHADGFDLICQGFESSGKDFGPDRDDYRVCVAFTGNNVEYYEQVAVKYNCLGYVWQKLFKNSIIQDFQFRFDTKIKFREDNLFVLRYLSHCSAIKCIRRIGYYYFMPDWDDKYIERIGKNNLLFVKDKCFSEIEKLYIDQPKSKVFYDQLNTLISDYISTFQKNPKRFYINKIRELTHRYPAAIKINQYLKRIIEIDSTITISWIFLYIYLRLYLRLIILYSKLSIPPTK